MGYCNGIGIGIGINMVCYRIVVGLDGAPPRKPIPFKPNAHFKEKIHCKYSVKREATLELAVSAGSHRLLVPPGMKRGLVGQCRQRTGAPDPVPPGACCWRSYVPTLRLYPALGDLRPACGSIPIHHSPVVE